MAPTHTLSTLFVYLTIAACWVSPIQSCPPGCTCIVDALTVNCNGLDLTEIPEGIPKNTMMLSLMYNKITVLDLPVLYGLKDLKSIDISSNEIKTIHGSFETFKNLTVIDISQNDIEAIPWEPLGDVLQQLNTLKLGGNPFNCDCDQWNTDLCDCSGIACTCNMQWLKEKVQKYPKLNLGRDVICEKPAAKRGKSIEDVVLTSYGCETKFERIVGGTVAAGGVLLLIGVGTVIIYLCRWKRKEACSCLEVCCRGKTRAESYERLNIEPPAEDPSLMPSDIPPAVPVDEEEAIEGDNASSGDSVLEDQAAEVHSETTRAGGDSVLEEDEAEVHSETTRDESDEDFSENEQPTAEEEPSASGPVQRTEADVYEEDIEHRPVSQRLPPQIARKLVTEQELNKLAMNLGFEWEGLAIALGVKKAEVDTCKQDHPGNTNMQILDMLLIWKARQKARATVGNLVKELETFDDGRIDEDKFSFFLESSEVTSQKPGEPADKTDDSGSGGPQQYSNEERPCPSQMEEDLLTFLRFTKSLLGINFIPGVDQEEETRRLQKISEWEKNFSSDQVGSISAEVHHLIDHRIRAVCKIEWPNGSGTGFLIGKREILTNDHVYQQMLHALRTNTDGSQYKATFDDTESEYTFHFRNTPALCSCGVAGLDYAILELDSEPNPLVFSPLGPFITQITGNTRFVAVVGFPSRGSKQVQYAQMAHVADTFAIYVHFGNPHPDLASYHTHEMYWASSGSPGFNSDGNIILLHTKGFFPYHNRPSVIEQGVKLTSIVEHARSYLTGEKFDELFPHGNALLGGVDEMMEVQEGH